MGYYTRFSLEIKDANTGLYIDTETDRDLVNKLAIEYAKITGYKIDSAYNDISIMINGKTSEWKWYEHENDMKHIASKFPNLIFVLEGEGEDRDDWWIKSFWGEKIAIRKAVLIPPDEEPEEWS